jgi:hypothetical protein
LKTGEDRLEGSIAMGGLKDDLAVGERDHNEVLRCDGRLLAARHGRHAEATAGGVPNLAHGLADFLRLVGGGVSCEHVRVLTKEF